MTEHKVQTLAGSKSEIYKTIYQKRRECIKEETFVQKIIYYVLVYRKTHALLESICNTCISLFYILACCHCNGGTCQVTDTYPGF